MIGTKFIKVVVLMFVLAGVYAVSQQNPKTDAKVSEQMKQNKSIETGKSTELSKAFIKKKIEPFKYVPVIPEFWKNMDQLLLEGKYQGVVEGSNKQLKSYGDTTPEGFEAMLARAMAFQGAGFPSYAFYQYIFVAQNQKGTMVGNFALLLLGEHIQKYDYERGAVFRLLDTYDVENMHPDVDSFIGYFRGLYLAKFGYEAWAKENFAKIQPDSYWAHLKKYWTAIAWVARGDMERAGLLFTELMKAEGLEKNLKDKVIFQSARINFEQGLFDEAFRLYEVEKDFGLREKGRQLLEKAWTKFYMADYGRSLGILHALKSPLFKASQTYEQFILEMLIFRQLCHYELVEYSADVFRKRFGKTIKNIQKRSPLRGDKVLFDLSVMNLDIQPLANIVARMKIEAKEIDDKNFIKGDVEKEIKQFYRSQSGRLQMIVDANLDERLRLAANNLLRADDQIRFLEYTSSLDALKLTQDLGESDYKSKKISKVKFEKMFWPVSSEYWYDELEDYSMQISSLCKTETNEEQKKLEENFE